MATPGSMPIEDGEVDSSLSELMAKLSPVLGLLRGDQGAYASFQRAAIDRPDRLRKSAEVLSKLTGTTPEGPPDTLVSGVQVQDNPAFWLLWLPWAKSAQYIDKLDLELTASKYGLETTTKLREITIATSSYAVPSPPVLEYISSHSPRIVEIGAGSGYWAHQLSKHGCEVVAVEANMAPTTRFTQWFPCVEQGKTLKTRQAVGVC